MSTRSTALRVVSGGSRESAGPANPPPLISVIIPTYRRPALLARCLRAVLAQRFDACEFEVIVVDDGHTDDTRAVVESIMPADGLPAVRYLRPGNGRGPAVARNCGWQAARGELIAFTDDDTIPDSFWLACGELAMRMNRDRLVALCGQVSVPLPPARRPTDHELMTLGLESAEFVTANAFVWREALARVGGFDERFKRAWHEDSDLHFRLLKEAGPVGRCPTARVVHPVRRERWGICLRQQRNAFFDALLYKKHPQLYRERIHRQPPWNYYLIVLLVLAVPLLALNGLGELAAVSGFAALGLVVHFALRRLRKTTRDPAHVLEMLLTSALIPFLSVYWRLLGAIRFRVLFW